MSLINPQDWSALKEKFQSAAPFPSLCIDNFLDEDFAHRVAKAYPSFKNARSKGQEFSAVNEKLKVQISDSNEFPPEVQQLHLALADESFLQNIRDMSGIDDLVFDPSFCGGGMHITGSTGILDVHVDFNYSEAMERYRRLNLLVYLNEDWQDNWGGKTELWDKDVKHCLHEFSPILNRCIMFATSDISFHGVSAVTTPANVARKSFAIYLYSKKSENSSTYKSHSTIFKARPQEKIKKYISMPVESGTRVLKHQGERASRLIDKIAHGVGHK